MSVNLKNLDLRGIVHPPVGHYFVDIERLPPVLPRIPSAGIQYTIMKYVCICMDWIHFTWIVCTLHGLGVNLYGYFLSLHAFMSTYIVFEACGRVRSILNCGAQQGTRKVGWVEFKNCK